MDIFEKIGWLCAGGLLGFAAGLMVLASEKKARDEQLWATIRAYEVRVAEILKKRG